MVEQSIETIEEKPLPNLTWMDSCSFTLVDSVEKLKELKNAITASNLIALDLETTGLDWLSDWIVGISIAPSKDTAYYIPINHKDSNNLSLDLVRQELQALLLTKTVVYFNMAYDRSMLQKANFDIPGLDVMILCYFQNTEVYKGIGLKKASKLWLDREMLEFKDLFTDEEKKPIKRKKPNLKINMKTAEHCIKYAGSDSINTRALYELLLPKLDKRQLSTFDLDNKFVDYIMDMQDSGFEIDLKYLLGLKDRMREKLSILQEEMNKAAGFEVNPRASASVWKALESFGVKPTVFTEKSLKPAFDADTMLEVNHPFAQKVNDYRLLSKTMSTFIKKLEEGIHPKTGKCHSMYPYTFTATGRLSSTAMKDTDFNERGINAQQVAKMIIPEKKNQFFQEFKGDSIRKAIVPPKGYVLASLDWSAVELRIAAHFSQEPIWLEGFKNNEDLHQKLADNINAKLGLSLSRDKAKTAQFNMLYAFYWSTFSQNQGISMDEAEMLYKAFFGTVTSYDRWRENYKNQAYRQGYAETLFGRRRVIGHYTEARELDSYLHKLNKKYKDMTLDEKEVWKNFMQTRSAGDREAVNHKIQGTCGDFIKIAGVRIRKHFLSTGQWKKDIIPMMAVHDELNFAVKGEVTSFTVDAKGDKIATVNAEALANIAQIRDIMQKVAPESFTVGLVNDVEIGHNWKELYKLNFGKEK